MLCGSNTSAKDSDFRPNLTAWQISHQNSSNHQIQCLQPEFSLGVAEYLIRPGCLACPALMEKSSRVYMSCDTGLMNWRTRKDVRFLSCSHKDLSYPVRSLTLSFCVYQVPPIVFYPVQQTEQIPSLHGAASTPVVPQMGAAGI
ncbi:hypothetical protein B0H19DRAFT_451419 [Mycena capillaripes]|nr:hypothetical protein B0H19DRAFT_451419 [Mycena capillaripes]